MSVFVFVSDAGGVFVIISGSAQNDSVWWPISCSTESKIREMSDYECRKMFHFLPIFLLPIFFLS